MGPEGQEETLEEELLGLPEPEEELQECSDHKPSMFEKGKPWSILSLPILANLMIYYACSTMLHLSDRNCLIPLMHIYTP